MARMHLAMGVPYFIDRDFTELADARGLQASGHPCAVVLGSTAVERCGVGGLGQRAHTLPVMFFCLSSWCPRHLLARPGLLLCLPALNMRVSTTTCTTC